ncbi:MAG: tetratricopeptide repeat protein [Vicinamibacterales bacterium]
MSPSRIDELRRRVQNDPASIAFAQLAEEYRRSGQTDEAVRVCREGLTRHPGYLSARVTLGRALLDLSQLADARAEFEFVVTEAPENLAAVRGLAEICQRDGRLADALTYYQRALTLARHDPEIEELVQQLSRQVGAASTGDASGLSFEEAHRELLSAAERVPVARPAPPPPPPPAGAGSGSSTAPFDFDRLVAALGTPSAPPQLEAVIEGRPGAAPVSLPALESSDAPNPFAALEAELRAQDAARAAAVPPADAAPTILEQAAEAEVSAHTAPDPPTDVAPEAAVASIVVSSPELEAVSALEAAAETPVPSLDFSQLLVEQPATLEAPSPVVPAEGAGDAGESTSDLAGAAAAAESSAGDDLLGDLEGWLNTLHERSNG